MGRFNSAKSSRLFWESLEEDKNPERAHRNKLSNRVKRRLKKNERVIGDELEFALSAARDGVIAGKLMRGEPLDEFEKLVIVGLLRMKLGRNQGRVG